MYIATLVILGSLLPSCLPTFVERSDFCIETDPTLLIDIGRRVVIPSEKDLKCAITATTLTAKEKASLVETLCKDHGTTTMKHSFHHYFKLRNGELSGRGVQQDICEENANAMLAWVPYSTMMQHYAAELNPKERLSYIAKATNLDREKTELCHFSHTDLVNGVADKLFTCVVMIFEDNFYDVDDNINVLVELQPLVYQLRNITYLPWRNVTNSYKMLLGNGVLKNPSTQRKPIYGSVNYAFVEKIRLNTSSIYNAGYHLDKLPLLLEHRGAVLDLDEAGEGGMDVQKQAYFGRTMDPHSDVRVQVIGQWVDQHREFGADVHEYYGHGLARFKLPITGARLTFVRIDNTEPVFEAAESSNLAKASLFRDMDAAPARLSVNGSMEQITEWEADEEEESSFYPWFVISCLLIGIVLIAVVYGVVRVYHKRNKQKQKYELANTSNTPASA
ncbi:enolase-binding protein [Drosophila sulfurigaster albostrigata]|uniref:enolase-binding protein n=1 Tax=Drosophila sulfurigaster albostrigata TaxID=89887 RepID=UPI002D21D47A|nr:enolase-binding protein [Drosophila sulfurigaster albostrigata]